jgi:hypothetical protein
MARFLRLGTLLAMVGVVAASAALANVPDPASSTVPKLIYCPKADLTYKVTVRDGSSNPIPAASVEVRINSAINGKICWCTAGGDAPSAGVKKTGVVSFTKTADGSGVAHFKLGAGGCVPYVAGSRIVEVFANTIKIGEVGTASPDVVDHTGKLPFDTGYAPTVCEVGAADATYLTPAFKTNPGASASSKTCGDLNSVGGAGLADVVIFTPHANGAHSCTKL